MTEHTLEITPPDEMLTAEQGAHTNAMRRAARKALEHLVAKGGASAEDQALIDELFPMSNLTD